MSEGVPVSATDNWTPETTDVREVYIEGRQHMEDGVPGAEFDRWLAAERAKAVAELANTVANLVQTVDTETDEPLQDWLAEQIWQVLPVEIRRASAAELRERLVRAVLRPHPKVELRPGEWVTDVGPVVDELAEVVAAVVAEARTEQREADAKIAESWQFMSRKNGHHIAAAIREGGNQNAEPEGRS